MSKGFTKKNYISGVRLHSIEAIIEYVIEPVHSYDDEVSDFEEREKKKVRKMKPEDVLKRQFAIRRLRFIQPITCRWISKISTFAGILKMMNLR